jgi:hypothetical protein
VEGNQPTLHDAVHSVFDRACVSDFAAVKPDGSEEVEDAPGLHEERYTTVIFDPDGLPPEWPDMAAVILVGREREAKGKRTDTAHDYNTRLRGNGGRTRRGQTSGC